MSATTVVLLNVYRAATRAAGAAVVGVVDQPVGGKTKTPLKVLKCEVNHPQPAQSPVTHM